MATITNADQSTSGFIPLLDNASTTNNYNYDDDTYDNFLPWTARDVAFALVRYLFPVIILVGTTGNLVSAAVMLRQRMRATSIYCYLLVLAVVDTVVLYVSAFKTWLRLVSGVEWLHLSTAACKTIMFLLLVALHLSAWLIVVVSADRFLPSCHFLVAASGLRDVCGQCWSVPTILPFSGRRLGILRPLWSALIDSCHFLVACSGLSHSLGNVRPLWTELIGSGHFTIFW